MAAGPPVAHAHAREPTAAVERRNAFHVVRGDGARAARVQHHLEHQALGAVHLGVVDERAALQCRRVELRDEIQALLARQKPTPRQPPLPRKTYVAVP